MKTQKRTQKLKRYSKQFCDQVRQDFPTLKQLAKTSYPIVKCFILHGKAETEKSYLTEEHFTLLQDGTAEINGFFQYESKTIEVYAITERSAEELKETIRHECLHFLLYDAGLPFDDEDDIFLFLSIKYNALPYGLLARPDVIRRINSEAL